MLIAVTSMMFFSISGGELFERVVDEDCLTEKEAAHYMYQILQGLQHMHDMSILHLDLKVTTTRIHALIYWINLDT